MPYSNSNNAKHVIYNVRMTIEEYAFMQELAERDGRLFAPWFRTLYRNAVSDLLRRQKLRVPKFLESGPTTEELRIYSTSIKKEMERLSASDKNDLVVTILTTKATNEELKRRFKVSNALISEIRQKGLAAGK